MNSFEEGYSFFEENSGNFLGNLVGDEYVNNIEQQIDALIRDLNQYEGFETSPDILKGNAAEFWHADTFNINAAVKGSQHSVHAEESLDFASPDIKSNFDADFGLKYYRNAAETARQQAKSVLERFKQYQSKGGQDSLETFLRDRGLDQNKLTDPLYLDQFRIVPTEQLTDIRDILQRQILTESARRPEEVMRYQETLDMLNDRIADGAGVESVPLSNVEAKELAVLAKEGLIDEEQLKKMGISTEDLVGFEDILREGFKSGLTAALITLVLRVAPEIYKAISFLIKNGELEEGQLKEIGKAAGTGAAEGFIRGTVAASITSACKSGLLGAGLKQVNPAFISVAVVIAMGTMKNAYQVATGKMEKEELVEELIRTMYVSTCSLVFGGLTQGIISIPILGYMLGSFLGSIVGAFSYNIGRNVMLSLCVDSGFTMFGLVDQDYALPDEVLEEIGFDVFEIGEFEPDKFTPEEFAFDEFSFGEFKYESLSIGILRRGIIGVRKIGYV